MVSFKLDWNNAQSAQGFKWTLTLLKVAKKLYDFTLVSIKVPNKLQV